jgi:hypothetical protein
MSGLVRSLYLGRGPGARRAKRAIKALTPQRLRHEALAFERRAQLGAPLAADEKVMQELRVRFKDEVVALSAYLERDMVKLWGYDGIG